MGVPEKLAAQAAKKLDETVVAAAMVIPPGATLYRAYAPDSLTEAAGGPIVAALRSKMDGPADGDAGTFPSAQGVVALTAERLVYFKKRLLGVGVGDRVIDWPLAGLTFTYEDNGKWSYPGLLIGFADGSDCVVFGEKRWGLQGIAEAGA